MKYFTIQELSHSDTAVARGIDNCPTAEAIHNLTKLVENVLVQDRQDGSGRRLIICPFFLCDVLANRKRFIYRLNIHYYISS